MERSLAFLRAGRCLKTVRKMCSIVQKCDGTLGRHSACTEPSYTIASLLNEGE